jgi:exodeoxyribonuclease-3
LPPLEITLCLDPQGLPLSGSLERDAVQGGVASNAMKLATWNVNSIKIRLPQLVDWLAHEQPDVVCLQETKVDDDNFPVLEMEAAGYRSSYSGQKAYNGVALLTRVPVVDVVHGIGGYDDEQKRVLSATVDGTRVICAYVPNGQSVDSDKYRYKLAWLDAFQRSLAHELKAHPRLAVLGDFNVAPEERDVHDPRLWEGRVLFSKPERTAFRALLDTGMKDSFRLFEQPERSYSWWDYRMNAFKRNLGLRIDHVLLSHELAKDAVGSRIVRHVRELERPSDHAPVITEIT